MTELPKLTGGGPMELYELLPDSDVFGYCMKLDNHDVYSIGVVEVPKEKQNQGKMTKFLERLDHRVGFPTVMSPHLTKALIKAGFVFGEVDCPMPGGHREMVDFWFRMEAWEIMGAEVIKND